MKKIIYIVFTLITLLSCTKSDGVEETSTGWDLTSDGKVYCYRCEPDGLYLYLDWNGENKYHIYGVHKVSDNQFQDVTEVVLRFLCVNKDGKHVYVCSYSDFQKYKPIIGFICDVDGGTGIYVLKDDIPNSIKLFEKYANK